LFILKKIPPLQQVASVYGVIVLMIYGWTMDSFIWQLPSWLHFLRADEILAIFAYSMITNFIESLLILSIPLLITLLLPRSWFYDRFVAQATAMVASGLAYTMYVASLLSYEEAFPIKILLKNTPLAAIGILLLTILVGFVKYLRKPVEVLADRTIIFLYLSLPLSILSLIFVALRNIF
jgi:hypothetical protein